MQRQHSSVLPLVCFVSFVVQLATPALSSAAPAVLETARLRFQLDPANGSYELADKAAKVTWRSNPFQPRFGEVTAWVDGKAQRFPLAACEARQLDQSLELTFRPVPSQATGALVVRVRALPDKRSLEFSYAASELGVESVRLLDEALTTTDTDRGAVLVPAREGLFIPADSGLAFTHRFDTYTYEGCHMQMVGVLKQGAAAMLTWDDLYVAAELNSSVTNLAGLPGRQALTTSLVLRKSAPSFRLHLLGRGDHNTVAAAYREMAREKGLLVTWDQKLKGHPDRAKYFGASNYKLWSMLTRQMNEDSSKELSLTVNWTFDEAAQVAEHLRKDLQMDRVLFIMGGWIHRGYDNQHPDILPSAPECGGDAAFADCTRRIRQLGYVLSLHDNYQDIYRDSPSWDERWINKNADGSLTKGGHWAGGVAYITCAKQAFALAQRPQNLVAVKKLTDADSYFIDTTYASGLYECFDKEHPMTRADDLKWKAAISDYARDVFGSFGSECGREWAIPHADFFEGLTGVSGGAYHDAGLLTKLGAKVVPLFELVYHDTIAMYGKYGYDPAQAADYVLQHLLLGRPLHYHDIPAHLYWKNPPAEAKPLPLRVKVAELKPTGPRRYEITYEWTAAKPVTGDWRVFVHFTDRARAIKFQNDHEPSVPTSKWAVGKVRQGPFTLEVPEGLSGAVDIRIGLFRETSGERAMFTGARNNERSCRVGRLRITDDKPTFEPATDTLREYAGDPAVFVSGDNGWTAGLHPLDRFVKNTHEILSPLNELTAQMRMTKHEFLTADRKVERSVFGEGKGVVSIVANRGDSDHIVKSRLGGEVVLPPYGFVVESPTFAAFHALSWGGKRYDAPVLFTLCSEDGKPLERSRRVKAYHGFGDHVVRLGKQTHPVSRQEYVAF
jgi:hypothetical protein